MSKYRNFILFIILLTSAAVIIGSKAKAWSNKTQKTNAITITLHEISKNTQIMKNERVKIRCRFATSGNMFRKKDDTFSPEKFENFSVWDDKVKFWNNADIKSVYPTMYISRDDQDIINKLRMLQRFTEIELTGTIESIYANMPWIRVEKLEIINNDDLNQVAVSQIRRAEDFINNSELQKAKICFEIALESKLPLYVQEYISSQQNRISEITQQKELTEKKLLVNNLLEQARENAKAEKFEKAATAYGKVLQVSSEYNNSAAIHKEIAGFFIDFYQKSKEESLLEYSIKEFNKTTELTGKNDSDVLYALAYIESIKAKKTHDYSKAEKLAKECIALNSLHYGGRKLLTEIMTAQLSQEHNNNIRKPVQQKTASIEKTAPVIDSLIDSEALLAMDEEIDNIDISLNKATLKLSEINSKINSVNMEEDTEKASVKGLTESDFNGLLSNNDNIILESESDYNKAENDLINTVLPDFPVSSLPLNSKLPELAL